MLRKHLLSLCFILCTRHNYLYVCICPSFKPIILFILSNVNPWKLSLSREVEKIAKFTTFTSQIWRKNSFHEQKLSRFWGFKNFSELKLSRIMQIGKKKSFKRNFQQTQQSFFTQMNTVKSPCYKAKIVSFIK